MRQKSHWSLAVTEVAVTESCGNFLKPLYYCGGLMVPFVRYYRCNKNWAVLQYTVLTVVVLARLHDYAPTFLRVIMLIWSNIWGVFLTPWSSLSLASTLGYIRTGTVCPIQRSWHRTLAFRQIQPEFIHLSSCSATAPYYVLQGQKRIWLGFDGIFLIKFIVAVLKYYTGILHEVLTGATGLPGISFQMCPFIREQGTMRFSDRFWTCLLHPLGHVCCSIIWNIQWTSCPVRASRRGWSTSAFFWLFWNPLLK